MKNFETIANEIKASEELQLKLKKAVEEKKLDEFLKEMDYEADAKTFIEASKPQKANGELNEDELDSVAGGINKQTERDLLSIFTLLIYCVIEEFN